MTHRWLLPASAPPGEPPLPGIEPLVARLLGARGLTEPGRAREFLNPRLADLYDPDRLPGATDGARRILDALDRSEKIVIYADYDVDGICAGTILLRACRLIDPGADVDIYIPHRLDEGYGLNEQAIDSIADHGASLIVTVDCGITGIAPARRALERGMDLVITDHHNTPADSADLPPATVIVHPAPPGADTPYPCRDICGAGVAFKVAWRMASLAEGAARVSKEKQSALLDLLCLAAMGTIADVVPLHDENRIIARHGLAAMPHCSMAGVRALLETCSLDGWALGAEDISFQIGPRLNAAGRMGHARDALDLLLCEDRQRADELARGLSRLNEQRKRTERDIAEQADAQAGEKGMTGDGHRAIVLSDDAWHPGVIGIACSRLVGRHHRPTILLGRDGNLCRGSGRSIDGFNLHEALTHCADELETFGGHDMAVGLCVRADRLDGFAQRLFEFAAERLSADDLVPSVAIDCEASPAELSPGAVRQLDSLEPFGRGNPRPTVLVRGLTLASDARTMGAGGAHMNLHARAGAGGSEMRFVAWRWGERAPSLRAGTEVDVVVRPRINEFRGRVSVEPEILDMRVCSGAALSV